MRYQPNRDYDSNDDVQTPVELARRLVRHFKPKDRILEPCRGEGNFARWMPTADWCEIKEGRDFFEWTRKVDWIVTNPPWSQIRNFLQHAMEVADHIVFLLTINHIWTKARIRDIRDREFGIREICLVEMPKNFPPSGFQLGAVYIKRGWTGKITLTDLSARLETKRSVKNLN
jgi:hypothetical protein